MDRVEISDSALQERLNRLDTYRAEVQTAKARGTFAETDLAELFRWQYELKLTEAEAVAVETELLGERKVEYFRQKTAAELESRPISNAMRVVPTGKSEAASSQLTVQARGNRQEKAEPGQHPRQNWILSLVFWGCLILIPWMAGMLSSWKGGLMLLTCMLIAMLIILLTDPMVAGFVIAGLYFGSSLIAGLRFGWETGGLVLVFLAIPIVSGGVLALMASRRGGVAGLRKAAVTFGFEWKNPLLSRYEESLAYWAAIARPDKEWLEAVSTIRNELIAGGDQDYVIQTERSILGTSLAQFLADSQRDLPKWAAAEQRRGNIAGRATAITFLISIAFLAEFTEWHWWWKLLLAMGVGVFMPALVGMGSELMAVRRAKKLRGRSRNSAPP
jgi:MFS family permease